MKKVVMIFILIGFINTGANASTEYTSHCVSIAMIGKTLSDDAISKACISANEHTTHCMSMATIGKTLPDDLIATLCGSATKDTTHCMGMSGSELEARLNCSN
jgi:hypothetical protein